LFVTSPVNTPANVAIALEIKCFLVICHLAASRVIFPLMWIIALKTSERSILVLQHIIQGV
jgi:hypothetical protein